MQPPNSNRASVVAVAEHMPQSPGELFFLICIGVVLKGLDIIICYLTSI